MDTNPFALESKQPTQDVNPYAISGQTNSADSQIGSEDFNGLCQRFAEQVTTGRTGIYPSAVDAWNDQAQKGNASTDFSQLQPNDLIYFAPDVSNGGAGHVGVYEGAGSMVSATYNGVQKSNVADWMKSTGQQPLGFVRGYK